MMIHQAGLDMEIKTNEKASSLVGQTFVIDFVDMNGLWGREMHPVKGDKGKLVVAYDYTIERAMNENEVDYTVFTCQVLGESRQLELADYEIRKATLFDMFWFKICLAFILTMGALYLSTTV